MKRKYLYMDWMKTFRCTGADCPMTCCGGWSIAINPKEIQMYKELAQRHPFGEKILEVLDEEKGCMKQCNDRCGLLTEEGWCKIVLACGEEYLSETCTYFPRRVQEFGDVLECMVEIVCPVVAENLFSREKIGFYLEELDDGVDEKPKEIDYGIYDALSLARTCLMELFQQYDVAYDGAKIYMLFSTIHVIEEMWDKDELNRNAMIQYMERWNEENCNAVRDAVAPITKRMDVKSVKILELINRLLYNGAIDQILKFVAGNTLKADYVRWVQNRNLFEQEIEEFTDWYRSHFSNVFENYFVYALFREWIPSNLEREKFGRRFLIRVVMWCLIQLCAMSVWKEKGTVTPKEYMMIIVGIERPSAHSSSIFNYLVELLENEDSVAKLLLYLIC